MEVLSWAVLTLTSGSSLIISSPFRASELLVHSFLGDSLSAAFSVIEMFLVIPPLKSSMGMMSSPLVGIFLVFFDS